MSSKCRMKKAPCSQLQKILNLPAMDAEDDDFEDPFPSISCSKTVRSQGHPLNHSTNCATRPSKKLKKQIIHTGKENSFLSENLPGTQLAEEEYQRDEVAFEIDVLNGGLDSIDSTIDFKANEESNVVDVKYKEENMMLGSTDIGLNVGGCGDFEEEFEGGEELDVLLKLCEADEDGEREEMGFVGGDDCGFPEDYSGLDDREMGDTGLVGCPLCGKDISELSDVLRQVHTNECLDKEVTMCDTDGPSDAAMYQCLGQVLDGSPGHSPKKTVIEWLHNLGLAKYEEVFVKEEIDWDSLKWLTEEDLCNMGIAALGPRKKLLHALNELKNGSTSAVGIQPGDANIKTDDIRILDTNKLMTDYFPVNIKADEIKKLDTNKLITDYFPGSATEKKRNIKAPQKQEIQKSHARSADRSLREKKGANNVRNKVTPSWCIIPGTPFQVDAFKYLRRDCSQWFLTHFHMDHYQGLTRSFSHGMIYCSSITAKLVNMKLGISWDKLKVLPLNQQINIAGIDVTCFDANHCPGAIIILFEPPNGKTVLHTGDFRFSDEIAHMSALRAHYIHTLILDTTYCNPQYDFPKQEAVVQFAIEAIQAEEFNPKTLFLIGSYSIGKERLFMEVARVLRKKIYVSAPKLRLLECLGFSKEDMQWFTLNENESHIHVVPMWTVASFKRLKYIANQYVGRFNLIVAFSPTGWTFGKGRKKTPGKKLQQGTMIRYEVPYSEHSSFSELRDFVKLISPAQIIPSVNNHGPESANAMISQLLA